MTPTRHTLAPTNPGTFQASLPAARRARALILALGASLGALTSSADVGMPSIFTSNMVIQHNATVPIWGWASPGETITVAPSWGPQAETVTDANGRWSVTLQTPEAPPGLHTPHTLTVKGNTTKTFTNVLLGEVWLCSGQSNMEWPLSLASNPEVEIAQANHPSIRLYTVKNTISLHPRIECDGEWIECTPESASAFSAVGYYFGRELQAQLGLPIGLISADWGGTPAQSWSSAETIAKFAEFAGQMDFIKRAADPETRASVTEGWEDRWWTSLDQPGPNRQPAAWRNPGFDASAWKKIDLPSSFVGDDLSRHDGIVYFVRTIDVPTEFAQAGGGGAGQLHLGPIDDRDTVWINGTLVGSTHVDGRWAQPRIYDIPAGLLKSGTNTIAIRVLDTAGLGAVGTASGRDAEMKITVGLGPSATSLPIGGTWSYALGPTMAQLPALSAAPQIGPGLPTVLYNGMIEPLAPFAIKGVIWYQGESNISNPPQYAKLFPAMIDGWRARWNQPGDARDFPFYFVQIAPFKYPNTNPSRVAELREAQAKALATSNTGMAVTLDIGDPADIHPRNKRDVGDRLARLALAKTYNQDAIEWSGPILTDATPRGSELRLRFDHAESIELRTATAPQLWIAGADKRFRPARARIDGDSIILSHPEIELPIAARYAWDASPQAVIFNASGLPAAPFRTDTWTSDQVRYDDDGRTTHLTDDPAFVPLFNGTNLDGWANINCDDSTWQVRDGMIICSGIPTGLLRTDRHYENFIMEVEFRHLRAGGNAGIFVWSDALPVTGQPFTRSVEVQVMDGLEGDWYTSDGDIFPIWGAKLTPENGRGGSRAFPTERRMNPSPQWNHYQIICNNGEISLAVNGKVVTRGRDATPRRGYICLEAEGSEVHFRNLRIKELPPASPPLPPQHIATLDEGFVPLYGGVNLSGWKRGPSIDGHWVPSDFVLRYDGKGDHLWSERSFKDFQLIADWRWSGPTRDVDRPVILPTGEEQKDASGNTVTASVKEAGDSGIYLRGSDKSQVNIWCWPVGSGEVYGYRTDRSLPPEVRAGVTPRANADKPIGEWNRFIITMKGDRLTVVLNGQTVIENAHLPGVPPEGPIALQHHGDPIEFANIYIRELK